MKAPCLCFPSLAEASPQKPAAAIGRGCAVHSTDVIILKTQPRRPSEHTPRRRGNRSPVQIPRPAPSVTSFPAAFDPPDHEAVTGVHHGGGHRPPYLLLLHCRYPNINGKPRLIPTETAFVTQTSSLPQHHRCGNIIATATSSLPRHHRYPNIITMPTTPARGCRVWVKHHRSQNVWVPMTRTNPEVVCLL